MSDHGSHPFRTTGKIIVRYILIFTFFDSRREDRRMVSSGILRRVALVKTDVSEELSASFIRVTRIGELGTTLAVTSNRRTKCLGISSHRASVASYS
jgi:hypothetical protein